MQFECDKKGCVYDEKIEQLEEELGGKLDGPIHPCCQCLSTQTVKLTFPLRINSKVHKKILVNIYQESL